MERLKRYLLATTGLIIITTAFALTTTGRALAQTTKQLWVVVFTDASGNPVGNTVKVSNLPPVSGTVAVNNFPAVQPISGSVSIGNSPTVNAQQSGPWSVSIGGGLDSLNTHLSNIEGLLSHLPSAGAPAATVTFISQTLNMNAQSNFEQSLQGASLAYNGVGPSMNVSYAHIDNPDHATVELELLTGTGYFLQVIPSTSTNVGVTLPRIATSAFSVGCLNSSDPCAVVITLTGDQAP